MDLGTTDREDAHVHIVVRPMLCQNELEGAISVNRTLTCTPFKSLKLFFIYQVYPVVHYWIL